MSAFELRVATYVIRASEVIRRTEGECIGWRGRVARYRGGKVKAHIVNADVIAE